MTGIRVNNPQPMVDTTDLERWHDEAHGEPPHAPLPPPEPPPPEPPSPPGPPPDPPPDPGPPRPPPPPGMDYARGGHVFDSGFWAGWRADQARNFGDRGDHGTMRAHASGLLYVAGAEQYMFRVRFNDESHLDRAGGTHVAGIASFPMSFTPRDIELPGSTRIDLNQPRSDGTIRVMLYNPDHGRLYEWTRRVDVGIRLHQWVTISCEWTHAHNGLQFKINEHEMLIPLRPNSPSLGRYVYVGNMDRLAPGTVMDFSQFGVD